MSCSDKPTQTGESPFLKTGPVQILSEFSECNAYDRSDIIKKAAQVSLAAFWLN